MKKQQKPQRNIRAKRVTVVVSQENADYNLPVLERFDFLVEETKDDNKLQRFLCEVLRRNKIVFDDIRIDKSVTWAHEGQLWTRKRIDGCIRSNNRVTAMLTEVYCPDLIEELVIMS